MNLARSIRFHGYCINSHRVKKGVSVFRKGSGKSNLNVSGTFPRGGYDVKREREK